jgi:hypothetical protein
MPAGALPMRLIGGNRQIIYSVDFLAKSNHILSRSVLSCELQEIEPASVCDDRDLKALLPPAAAASPWLSPPAVPAWTSL